MAYIDKYGVEFSDDRKVLIKFPIDYSGSYKIPEGVETIEEGSFKEDYGLGGQPQYKGCDGLLSIDIPNSLKDIDIILKWCKKLQQVLVDESNPFYCIDNGVLFDKDKKILKKYFRTEPQDCYIVPDSVQKIAEYAFADNAYIASVDVRNVISIGERAFESCESLEYIQMPNVQDIKQYAFCLCKSLRTVVLPLSLQIINASLFYNCSALESVIIPDSVSQIAGNAFGECKNLKSISIPDSVDYINGSAFVGTEIYNDMSNWEGGVLYIGHSLIKASKSISGTYTIKNGTIQICDYAFYHCDNLKTVILPEGVVCIGNGAFCQCERLTKVALPETLKEIGSGAFDNCISLSLIVSTDSLSFEGIYINLVDIKIPNNVITIKAGAFANCKSMRSIAFPEGLSNIGWGTCTNCQELRTVCLPSTIKSIENFAFRGCSALESINLPDGLSSVGYNVFEDCFSINEIIVSRKFQDQFRAMKGLEDVVFRIVGRDSETAISSNRRSWNDLKRIWIDLYHNIEEGNT